MSRQFPSFAALRAFEAAGRHLSFKKASQELSLTPSAISHQITALEAQLDLVLFHRTQRGLVLSEFGHRYLIRLRHAFDLLESALQDAHIENTQNTLSVGCYMVFAVHWLIPRLGRFYASYPQIDVRVLNTDVSTDFASSGMDVAIDYGNGDWPGKHADYLLSEEIFPVCSPSYATMASPLREPADLIAHTLLHNQLHPHEWADWLAVAGVEGLSPNSVLVLDSRLPALQAAVDGVGVAIGRRPFVNADLSAHRLLAPFDVVVESESAYYLICPEDALEQPKITAFRSWLAKECCEQVQRPQHST